MSEIPQGIVLSDLDRNVLNQAAGLPDPTGARVRAILALDEGANEDQVSARSGLTPGQIRYWKGRVRTRGITAIDPALVPDGRPESQPVEPAATTGADLMDEKSTDEGVAQKETGAPVTAKTAAKAKKDKPKKATPQRSDKPEKGKEKDQSKKKVTKKKAAKKTSPKKKAAKKTSPKKKATKQVKAAKTAQPKKKPAAKSKKGSRSKKYK